MTREEIKQRKNEISNKISELLLERTELSKQYMLLSDEKQQFIEQIEHHPREKYQRSPNFLDGKLVGRIHWKDELKDDDTGEIQIIERSKIVRIDGKWVSPFDQFNTVTTKNS